MNTMQKVSGTDLITACYCMCCFFFGFKTENQSWLVITGLQNFLELIWLLHVIVCAVFSGF